MADQLLFDWEEILKSLDKAELDEDMTRNVLTGHDFNLNGSLDYAIEVLLVILHELNFKVSDFSPYRFYAPDERTLLISRKHSTGTTFVLKVNLVNNSDDLENDDFEADFQADVVDDGGRSVY